MKIIKNSWINYEGFIRFSFSSDYKYNKMLKLTVKRKILYIVHIHIVGPFSLYTVSM